MALVLARPLVTLLAVGASKLNGFDESTVLPFALNENDVPKYLDSNSILKSIKLFCMYDSAHLSRF